MKFEKEFKEALRNLPVKEKDKLILRLLKNDLTLANRLTFELLSTTSIDDRRSEMEDRIKLRVERITESFYRPSYLMMEMRDLSGEINEHVSVTRDKLGEASLNTIMLIEVLKGNNTNIEKFTYGNSYKFCIYIIARAFKILLMIDRLHSDYRMEFNEDLKKLGVLIGNSEYLMKTAINNGLDVNWLLTGETPEDIKEMHKSIRAQGFLK
ncbi:MAG: hypothetical protein L3J34_02430 [Flavobacteriaceae bacterium]|nr:hypothetical protein [Flavobacteriaceae bacterium]